MACFVQSQVSADCGPMQAKPMKTDRSKILTRFAFSCVSLHDDLCNPSRFVISDKIKK